MQKTNRPSHKHTERGNYNKHGAASKNIFLDLIKPFYNVRLLLKHFCLHRHRMLKIV